MTTTRVVMVDDHELIRSGLGAVLDLEDDIEVVGTAATVAAGLAAHAELAPDVMVVDLQMQDGTGLDIIRTIRAAGDRTAIVVLSMHSGDDQIFASLQAGASGFVGKDAPAGEVIRAIRTARVSPAGFVCTGLTGALQRRQAGQAPALTEREHDVLVLLAEGLGAGAIGARLYLSETTAKSHISRIYQKLGVANRAQALVTAMRIGLLPTGTPTATPTAS